MNHSAFIERLVSLGWNLERAATVTDYSGSEVAAKIDQTSDEFKSFIRSFSLLANAEDNIWFLSLTEYLKENDGEGFAWNEFELQSLEAAEDEEEVAAIKAFWNAHLPFMLSVKNGYAYFAIVLDGADKGKIVIGNEPMYEETTVVADDLPAFFDVFVSFVESGEGPVAFSILK